MAPQKSLFWHLGQKYNFVDRYFFWYGFSIIWAIFMLKHLILSVKLFSQIQKNFFFYNPHHSDKKRRTIAEFSTDFEKFFTFVIRITFLTKYGVPKRIWECDLVQQTPIKSWKIFQKVCKIYISVFFFCLKLPNNYVEKVDNTEQQGQ